MGSRKLDGERWAEPLPCAEHCRHSERTTATKAQDAHLNKTQPTGHGMKSKSKQPHRSRAVCVHPAPHIRGGAPSPHSSAEIHAPAMPGPEPAHEGRCGWESLLQKVPGS